jgi:hypothetical protein
MERLELPINWHAFEISCFKLSDGQLRSVLGEPHYIETDSTRTFGGNESLWAYELEGVPFAVVCRIPYSDTVIYAREAKPSGVIKKVCSLFPEAAVEIYDEPFQI